MKWRDDIDLYNTWVVSDTHFGHDNIVGFCHRPEDHEQVMIAEWRAQVPDDGHVIHLGDLCYKSNARFKAITAKELTGATKWIIQGNHDKQRFSFYRDCGFRVVKPFKIGVSSSGTGMYLPSLAYYTGDNGKPVALEPQTEFVISFSHYTHSSGPLPENERRLHGHIHNNGYSRDTFVPFLRNHINVSVEQTKYRPVNLGVLLRAYLLGEYPETTEEQLVEARNRKEANRT
jgi:calcineurin-like phosphoesterase family protein